MYINVNNYTVIIEGKFITPVGCRILKLIFVRFLFGEYFVASLPKLKFIHQYG